MSFLKIINCRETIELSSNFPATFYGLRHEQRARILFDLIYWEMISVQALRVVSKPLDKLLTVMMLSGALS